MAGSTLEAQVEELGEEEDVGYYFSYLGGVCFRPRDAPMPGNTALVATSNRHGLTFFSDLSGG